MALARPQESGAGNAHHECLQLFKMEMLLFCLLMYCVILFQMVAML